MGKTTAVNVAIRRALNQAMLYSSHAPACVALEPGTIVRAVRSALRMSQAQLARRCRVPQSHIARLEAAAADVRLETLRRMLDAMFCDLLILPRPRKRLSDMVAERDLAKPATLKIWDD